MTTTNCFYLSMVNMFTTITVFIMAKFVINIFCHPRWLETKACLCVILGSVLGMFIGTPLNAISREWGYIGIGFGIVIAIIIGYSGAIQWLIRKVPLKFRKLVKTTFKVIGACLGLALVVGIVSTVLMLLH